jgi:hypothetical protein
MACDMTKPRTQAERMQRIETLVEQGFFNISQRQTTFDDNWKEVKDDLEHIKVQMQINKDEWKSALDLDVADLAELKNRGIGILTGVSILVGLAGASLAGNLKAGLSKMALMLGG